MAKINIAIADSDELYLQQLTNYLIKNAGNFEVCSFTAKEALATYLADKGNKVDIIAFSEDLADECIAEANIPAKIVLTDGSFSSLTEYDSVNKYQKTDKFMSDLLLVFAEKSGRVEAVSLGDKETEIVGVYSPVGGAGKTTLALGTSYTLATQGKKVFYLNAEKINSTVDVLNKAASGSLSDLYLTLKTKGANVGLRIMANKFTDTECGISYINPAESSLEINELTADEFERLIDEFEKLGEFDVVVIDFDSDFSKEKIALLNKCDRIIVPFTDEAFSVTKIKLFVKELGMYDELTDIKNKSVFVRNKALGQNDVVPSDNNFIETKASISVSPIFSDIRNIFHSDNRVLSTLTKITEYI